MCIRDRLYCLHFRYEKLKQICNEVIYTSMKNEIFSVYSSDRVTDIKLLHKNLSDIVELMNNCCGSRCVILHGQLFHFILMYFYLMFTEIKLAALVLPFYFVPALLISIASQNLCSSVSINKIVQNFCLDRKPYAINFLKHEN